MKVHTSINETGEKFFNELRRKRTRRRKSYLDLIGMYSSKLGEVAGPSRHENRADGGRLRETRGNERGGGRYDLGVPRAVPSLHRRLQWFLCPNLGGHRDAGAVEAVSRSSRPSSSRRPPTPKSCSSRSPSTRPRARPRADAAADAEVMLKTGPSSSEMETCRRWREGLAKCHATQADAAEEKTLPLWPNSPAEVKAVADDAQADLDVAMPALNNAVKALDSLTKADITEVKAFAKPVRCSVLRTRLDFVDVVGGGFFAEEAVRTAVASLASSDRDRSAQAPAVQITMEGVCVMLDEKPDWPTAKKVSATRTSSKI